ncbi:unnamed protein product [Anisakis simplex]|uniref:Nuclear distribution protein nudE homolog (inferred by orthology to a D. melanogaster protein) n=1 Tax=Anisakis simplex TaxID=6269 RepID=A0A0M3JY14_ANISI|nr:unnamed protein product [Anisakis simplex]
MTETLTENIRLEHEVVRLQTEVERYRFEWVFMFGTADITSSDNESVNRIGYVCGRLRAQEARNELEEHVSYSRQLEAEFDEEMNGLRRDLTFRDRELTKLKIEHDKLKENLTRTRKEALSTNTQLREQLQVAVEERDRLAKQVQHLEQQNDDLERQLRSLSAFLFCCLFCIISYIISIIVQTIGQGKITCETLTSTERNLNAELEARALLTTELELNDELKEQCQRLEDEIRDLKLDNTVKETKLKNFTKINDNNNNNDNIHSPVSSNHLPNSSSPLNNNRRQSTTSNTSSTSNGPIWVERSKEKHQINRNNISESEELCTITNNNSTIIGNSKRMINPITSTMSVKNGLLTKSKPTTLSVASSGMNGVHSKNSSIFETPKIGAATKRLQNGCLSPSSSSNNNGTTTSATSSCATSSPLARNVSPIITDLLRTIQGTLQALEMKLHRICPERRATANVCEDLGTSNGFASPSSLNHH